LVLSKRWSALFLKQIASNRVNIFKMKKCVFGLLVAFALVAASSIEARADQFSRIENSPYTYWVPAPTPPPPGYEVGSSPYYYAPPPPAYYYGPPPPAPVVVVPRFFIGFHFH
jgi:hypothetical protein